MKIVFSFVHAVVISDAVLFFYGDAINYIGIKVVSYKYVLIPST